MSSNVYKFRLEKSFRYSGPEPFHNFGPEPRVFSDGGVDWLTITPDGHITILKDYCWDGCTPKLRLFDLYLPGTPDGIINVNTGRPKTYYASLVHDVLYQFMDDPHMPYSRFQADQIFRDLLTEADFIPTPVYYGFVRMFGRLWPRIRQRCKTIIHYMARGFHYG